MNPRLRLELAWRRHPGLLWVGLVMLATLPLLAWHAASAPAPEIVAASDAGSRRAEAHYQAFRAILLPRDALEAKQNAIIDLALRHGLVPGRIEYGAESSDSGIFDRATLAFPLRGEFVDFQKFLGAALASEPALGVAELALQRDEKSNGIHAQLRLVFHMQAGGHDRL